MGRYRLARSPGKGPAVSPGPAKAQDARPEWGFFIQRGTWSQAYAPPAARTHPTQIRRTPGERPRLGSRPAPPARSAPTGPPPRGRSVRVTPRKATVVLHEFAGRKVVDRAAMVADGIGRSTIDAQYKNRAETKFPEKATTEGRTDYWFADEWQTWLAGYKQRKQSALTTGNRTGHADDLVYADEAAQIMGWASGTAVTSAVSRGYIPPADDYDGVRPRWKRSTVWAAADARAGKGTPRSRTRKPRTPKAEATPGYASDQRVSALCDRLQRGENPQAVDIAGEHGVSTRTAERWLRAARDLAS
jgi:hypothetical protein